MVEDPVDGYPLTPVTTECRLEGGTKVGHPSRRFATQLEIVEPPIVSHPSAQPRAHSNIPGGAAAASSRRFLLGEPPRLFLGLTPLLGRDGGELRLDRCDGLGDGSGGQTHTGEVKLIPIVRLVRQRST